jgi:hypothetical protein
VFLMIGYIYIYIYGGEVLSYKKSFKTSKLSLDFKLDSIFKLTGLTD